MSGKLKEFVRQAPTGFVLVGEGDEHCAEYELGYLDALQVDELGDGGELQVWHRSWGAPANALTYEKEVGASQTVRGAVRIVERFLDAQFHREHPDELTRALEQNAKLGAFDRSSSAKP